jgi:hypothetical protein
MHRSHRPKPEILFEIGQDMQAGNVNATAIAAAWAAKLSVSKQTIFRWVKESNHYSSGKKKKRTAGKINPELEQHLWNLATIYHCITDPRKPDSRSKMPLWVAKDTYVNSRLPEKIKLPSDGRILQYFRQLKISRRDKELPTPKLKMRTLHSNHVFAYDTGVCDYYLGKDKQIIHIPGAHQYPGKERFDKKRRLVRHIIIDMFSGAFYVYYTFQQKRIDYADFLYTALKAKEGDFIFHGLPKVLLMDNDVGLRSRVIMGALALLGIKVPPIKPYHAWVKGTVEGLMKIWARVFEARFLLDQYGDLDKINELAVTYAVKFQKTRVHSRTKMTRFAAWDKYIIDPETGESHLVEMPDYNTYKQLFFMKPVTRQVDKQGLLKYEGQVYKVPGIYSAKVDVIRHLYLYEAEKAITIMYPSAEENPENYLTFEVTQMTVRPSVKVEGGYLDSDIVVGEEYGRIVKDQRTRNLEKVQKTERPKNLRPFDIPIPPEDNIAYIIKTGKPATVTPVQTFDPDIYTKTQVKAMVRKALKRSRGLSVEEAEYINTLEGDKFSLEKIDEIVELFKTNTLQNQQRRTS